MTLNDTRHSQRVGKEDEVLFLCPFVIVAFQGTRWYRNPCWNLVSMRLPRLRPRECLMASFPASGGCISNGWAIREMVVPLTARYTAKSHLVLQRISVHGGVELQASTAAQPRCS